MFDKCASYTPSRCSRVHIELIDPLLVQHHQGYRFTAAVGDPHLAAGEYELFEPPVHLVIGMDGERDRWE
jgi:hypothetical protein